MRGLEVPLAPVEGVDAIELGEVTVKCSEPGLLVLVVHTWEPTPVSYRPAVVSWTSVSCASGIDLALEYLPREAHEAFLTDVDMRLGVG
jgi:hypothetical protein